MASQLVCIIPARFPLYHTNPMSELLDLRLHMFTRGKPTQVVQHLPTYGGRGSGPHAGLEIRVTAASELK